MEIKFFLLFLMMYLGQMWLRTWNYLFGDWYHKTFEGCIYMVEVFNLKNATKSTLERQTMGDIMTQRKRTTFLVYPWETQGIFKITCTDDTKHLTKRSFFSMKEFENRRNVQKVLSASLVEGNRSIDVTNFVNTYYTSLNNIENFTVAEIVKIAYTENVIPSKEYYKFRTSPIYLEVIYDNVDLTTKKFEEIIVL